MQLLELITVNELKAGRIFYFKNKDNTVKIEVNYSQFFQSYCLVEIRTKINGVNTLETTFNNLYFLKDELKELIYLYDLKLILNPIKKKQKAKQVKVKRKNYFKLKN